MGVGYEEIAEKHQLGLKPLHDCPLKGESAEGEVFVRGWLHQPRNTLWLYHPAILYANAPPGVPSNTWIEVMHQSNPNERNQMWFLTVPGSGIWFFVGNTRVFPSHADALMNLLGGSDHKREMHRKMRAKDWFMEEVAERAVAKGIDSHQFTRQLDTAWICPDDHIWMGMEIVGYGLSGRSACGQNISRDQNSRFSSGWKHERPCNCDNEKYWLNCQGAPEVVGNMKCVFKPELCEADS